MRVCDGELASNAENPNKVQADLKATQKFSRAEVFEE
jgi:hypothetical protein